MDTQTEPLITAEEAATALGLSRRTVYDLAAQGTIPCWRFGRAVRFRLSEVLDATRQEPGARDLEGMTPEEMYEALGLGAAA